jgi:tetratricopeptide (TPR) repeat protein
MEAAAARLQALIQAKEEAESKEEDDALDALSTPTTNTAPIPAPFATPAPVPPPFSPPPPTASPDLLPIEEPITQHLTADDLSEVEEDLSTQSIPLDADDALIEDDTSTPLFIEEQDVAATEEYSTEEIAEEIAHTAEETPLFEEETFDGAFGEDDFGDFDDAFEEVQEEEIVSFDVEPDDPFIEELEEAAFYLDQEEPQYAIEIFDRILQKAPDHAAAQAGLQMALQAEQEIQTAAQEDDGFLVNLDAALGAVASTKRERDRVEGELKAFQQEAQKQFGEDGEALYELGVAYYGMALYDMAVGAFQNCLRNQYREFDCYKMIGTCYGSQGQNDQAIEAYQQALQLPTLTTDEKIDVLFELGQALENSGNTDDALAHYQQVYMLDEHYRGVQERIQHLRAG